MVASLPTLNTLWRPNSTGPAPNSRNDRELIRSYSDQPSVQVVYHDLTVAMNRLADVSPAGVAQVQTWINEIEDLEEQWSGYVADGTAAQLQAAQYEGPIGGVALSRDSQLKRADVLEWDTQANRVRISNGAGGTATQANAIAGRIAQLRGRILKAMDLAPSGQAQLLRS
jgi:hypothetical protein